MVSCAGQLIGVPTAGATVPSPSGESSGGSIGLGFAIPVDLAKTISDEIIATGRVTHAFFGLATLPIPPAAAAQAGLPEGLYVQAVTPGGPAATAGLRVGDVITKINGEPATSNIQLQELTLTKKPGDTVPIEYSRDGKSLHIAADNQAIGSGHMGVGYPVTFERRPARRPGWPSAAAGRAGDRVNDVLVHGRAPRETGSGWSAVLVRITRSVRES
jgi:S1-C subfamily serine protease